jgi:Fe-S-cluster containining protein
MSRRKSSTSEVSAASSKGPDARCNLHLINPRRCRTYFVSDQRNTACTFRIGSMRVNSALTCSLCPALCALNNAT